MRFIMLAMAAAFIFTGAMAGITTARADDSATVIKHDGDKTVVKKHNDDATNKKIIIKKHDE